MTDRMAPPSRGLRTRILGLLAFVIPASFAASAQARPGRPRFEPTDLDLEEPGVAEFDLQVGPARSDGAPGNRMILPDFELDVGLLDNVEIDIDGAFAVERFDLPSRKYTGEPVWAAAKLGLFDSRTDGPSMTCGSSRSCS